MVDRTEGNGRVKERQRHLEEVLQRLREQVRGMEGVGDWEMVLYLVIEELQHIGVPFEWSSLLLVDLEEESMHGFGHRSGRPTPYRVSKRPLRGAVRQAVTSGEVVYRPDVWVDDPFNELDSMRGNGLHSVLDVPFRNGTIGLSHRQPRAYDEVDIEGLQRIGEVLSDGVQRAEDLRTLEERNLALEREIAERERMEKELVRSQRLRAIGELSAGVSHNLNNLLAGILGPAQLLERMIDDPEVKREVEEIIAAAHRARDLVHRLHLSVQGVEEEEPGPVELDAELAEVVRTLRPRWQEETEEKGISVEVAVAAGGGPPIRATVTRLRDLLSNLLINAVEALPSGGKISIETKPAEGGVQLLFSDTGIGMDEETRQRIFEPFFTTKKTVGSGLGLSTVYGTVKRWGGEIGVRSAPGEGTTFRLLLPTWSEGLAQEPEEEKWVDGRLLIVDDDQRVRSLLRRLLESRYEVEVCENAEQALEWFAPDRCDVALIDLGMPVMPGDRLARQLRQADPQLATILISGWELEQTDPRRRPFDFQLSKPFADLEWVEEVVGRALELHEARMKAAEDLQYSPA